MIINARYHTGLSLSPSMDYSCARVALLEAQLPPDRVLYYQQAEPQGLPEAGHMDYIDSHHHQYKHHHHHHHIQQQALQHHHPHQLPVAGSYVDLGGGFVTTEASPVPFDVLSQVEKEKQGPPQNHYVDQYGSASVQASYKPCEDGYVSVKTHEDSHCPPKACEDAHILPGRHENLHYACDRGYSQHHPQFSMNPSASVQPRIRLLCSIGGRIMGRPVDGKLRYCGGDTRLITVERGICFSDLMAKLTQLYGSPLIVKYQLPGEDLDALVSVSSDDDLQNMLDEYDKLVASGGNSWFRLFMFKVLSDCEIFSHLSFFHESRNCYAEMMQRYVNAINGASELPTDVHLENSLNDHYSSSRMAFDGPNTTLAGSCFSAKPSSWGPSAPSSVPSSPSVAARQTRCRQCGTGDMSPQLPKDHQSFVAPMNNVDLGTQELNQDRHVEALKCDHRQSQILGEGPRIQQDSTFSRGDSLWVKENGTCFVDSHDTFVPQFERHRGTGTIHMDTLPKPLGLIDCQSDTCCGSHPVAQPLTSQSYHGGQTEDDFGRVEPAHHCYTEGHKQVPLLHQSHQVGPLVHREGLTRLQRGPAIDSTCADGSLPFSQEPVHPHLQIATVMSSVPTKVMGSAPSSPKDVYHGRCCCCRQHLQVDRGINVSLGEHSHSKKPSHLGDQSIRRLGSPLLSRFCDGSNACFDAAAWHCPQTLGKGLEFDELEHERCLRKHTLDNINTWSNFNEGGAKESSTHGFVGPVHGLHERSLHRCRHCCSDFNDLKGQHKEKARVFPIASEFQAYMGDCDVHRGSHEAAGRLAFDQKTDLNVERGNDSLLGLNFNYGQGELETRISNVQDGRDVSGYAHILVSDPSSMLGHQESGRDLKSASFSSTDAVAGSLSRSSLEPPIWVVSSPRPVYEDHSKEVEVRECSPPVDSMASIRQLVDGISNHESTGDACRSSSFSCMDSYGRLRSGDAGECRVENSPVSSLIHVPEDKTNISYAQGSQPKFDNFCSVSSSQPFLMRTLDSDNQKGSIALVMPIYDQSPVSSVSNATFLFAQNEDKSANNGKDVLEQCVNSRNTLTVMPYQSLGQHEDIAQTEADACAHKVPRQEIMSVPEEVKSLSNPSSRQCSVETGAHDKGDVKSKTIPFAQSSMADETLQEVNVSGSANICTEGNEKELPATQAEAEAIARGLQIIKNDDLEDLKELGSGTYGTVFHGKWRGSDVAIKRIKASCFMGRPSMQERLISDFWREAATLSQLHHPNIVAFYGVVPDGPGGTLATVTEYMVNGSLKQVLVKKDRTIDRRKRLLIAMDAAFGMEYLHSKRIVHFDLKSENLLVNMRDAHRPICKVGDFGLSKVKHQTLVSGGVRGTLPWMAPELLSGKGLVTEKVDVYSFGIVMWELLTGEEPYANMHCGTIIGGIANDNLRPAIPSWCDPSWRDLMERCWSGNPADRPGFATVASELRAIASSMNIK